MPSRLPVSVGQIPNLKSSDPETVRAQLLTGVATDTGDAGSTELLCTQNNALLRDGTRLTKERLLSMGHGVVRAEDQASSTGGSAVEGHITNPVRWENNAARKQLDMQWHFTCGPLRVSEHTGKNHWDRLHSSNISAIPQPGGGVHVLRSSIPHATDSELAAKAAKIGVPRRMANELPPLPVTKPPSTPMLRKYLADNATKPVPRRLSGAASTFTDGSSVFSRTTVSASAAKTGVRGTSSEAGSRQMPAGTSAGSVAGDRSTVSRLSQQSKQSSAESIRVEVEREKTQQRDLAAELRVAANRLAALEALLDQ